MSQPSTTTSPPASRLARPRWRDLRLLLGLGLVLTSVLAGARLLASADDTEPVWVAARDLGAGTTLSTDDLTTREVRLGSAAAAYLGVGGAPPAGYVLTRSVAAGELVPAAAVVGPDAADQRRLVTVPVERFHYPGDLARGARVDVYVTGKVTAERASPQPQLVLADALVDDVQREAGRLGPSGTGVGVVLSVGPDDVSALVGALQRGAIDLVRVPGG